ARPTEGLLWARHAEALLDRTGREPDATASYHNARANIAVRTGDYAQAEVSYRAALAAHELEQPRDELAIARVLNNLASTIGNLGKLPEALELLQRALEIRTANLGPDHPDIAFVLSTIGGSHALLGDAAAAEQAQRRALAIWRAALPPGHERLAYPLSALGDIALERARYEEARAHYEEAHTIWRSHYGPDHPQVLSMQERLAGVMFTQGDLTRARASADEALEIWDSIAQPEPGGFTLILLARAQIAVIDGDHAKATALMQRALDTAVAAFGEGHLYAASTRMLMLGHKIDQGRAAEALPGLVALVAEFAGQYGDDARWLIEPLLTLGRARHAVKDYAAARADLERARKLATVHGIVGQFGDLDLALARVLWDSDADRPGARTLAQAAVEVHRRSGAARSLAEAETWLKEHPLP
ncbi:MAG TPA: tetratricopeptide repeat protein, partial [Nannocystis sp.]